MHRFILCLIIFFSVCLLRAESKTVLVTGGAGFMGSHFVEYMYNKYPDYQFVVLDALTYSSSIENIPDVIRQSPRFTFVHGSICNKQLIDQLLAKANFVIHFAAETDVSRSISDDEIFYETNVMDTRNLMHYLVKHKNKVERFVHISSSEIYGTCEREEIDEQHPMNPRSPYAASKAGADRTVFAYGCTYNVPVVILRFFNNYGPRQHVEKVIPKFIALALSKEPITIHGSGQQSRDWIFVTDTARAIDAALHIPNFETIRNKAINCGSGKATSIMTIATHLKRYLGLTLSKLVHGTDRPGQVFKHLSSSSCAKQLLGWQPLVSFEEGLIQTIKWYQEHPKFWKKQICCDAQIRKDNACLIIEKIEHE